MFAGNNLAVFKVVGLILLDAVLTDDANPDAPAGDR
jgi:hypothetical protein